MKESKILHKQQHVLNAASKIFLLHGFSSATTDMIQKEAAVSKATLYACYESKQAMFSAVIEQQSMQMEKIIRPIQAEYSDLSTVLSKMGKAYLSFILSPNGLALFRVCIAEAVRFPEQSYLFFQVGPQKMLKIVSDQLKYAANLGEINLNDFGLDNAASIFLSLLRGHCHLEYLTHAEARVSEAQINLWVEQAVNIFIKIIKNKFD